MHPVNAEQAIFVANVERKELLARAERERLVKEYGVATGFLPRLSTLSGRVLSGLGGARDTLVRVRGARPVPIGEEVAATPSA